MVYLHCPSPIPMPIQRLIPMELDVIVFLRRVYSWAYANSYSDADGYCTQFDTDISTDKGVFKENFIRITIGISPFLHIIGIAIRLGIGQCKYTIISCKPIFSVPVQVSSFVSIGHISDVLLGSSYS